MSTNREDAERWIERGNDAWRKADLDGTAWCFENAVAADPQSLEARLGFGVANSFLYIKGCSDARHLLFDDPDDYTPETLDRESRLERANAVQIQENGTHGKAAEENLLEALRLDNRNMTALRGLAWLQQQWISNIAPDGRQNKSRQKEAQQGYTQILEMDPEDADNYYDRGALGYEMASAVVQQTLTGRNVAIADETRRAVHEQVGPLLDQAFDDFSRSLELNPDNVLTVTFLAGVKALQARSELTEEKRQQTKREAEALIERANSIRGAHTVGDSATIVFRKASGSKESTDGPPKRCFPPPGRFMQRVPPPLPPPPPPKH